VIDWLGAVGDALGAAVVPVSDVDPEPAAPPVLGSGPCPVVVADAVPVGAPSVTTRAADTGWAAVVPECPVLVGYMNSSTRAASVLNAASAMRLIAAPPRWL
jgi:hypothetical protein